MLADAASMNTSVDIDSPMNPIIVVALAVSRVGRRPHVSARPPVGTSSTAATPVYTAKITPI